MGRSIVAVVVVAANQPDDRGGGQGRQRHHRLRRFVHMMTDKMGERDARDELYKAFRIIDKDGNGKISDIDIQRLAIETGEHFTLDEVREMIEAADENGDGEIDLEEFMKMMRRTNLGSGF
ncbi:putative calcium-binding protein CML8 [Panicum miliaceum]|uniref:Calcium-binding protein CML8 n=1 Tax=Panicum miliaceum TaxID=4540 RepID=A0A3L6TGH3_PANMI|nr:putative calcium-binding protein CML8 [Panicum miliaceum]